MLMSDPGRRRVLEHDLCVELPQPATMRDLTELVQRRQIEVAKASPRPAQELPKPRAVQFAPESPRPPAAQKPAAPASGSDALLGALSVGNIRKANDLLRQGVLQTGRAMDRQGHTIFWQIIAREMPELALIMLQQFPPQVPTGIDICELHGSRGDSLLHLLCGSQRFDARSAELFKNLLTAMPQKMRVHLNKSGQTFLHAAAARLNSWVLVQTLSRDPSLVGLCSQCDASGYTPLNLLARHLRERTRMPREPPAAFPARSGQAAERGQSNKLRPSQPGGPRPSAADVELEIEDESKGHLHIWAHRAVLAQTSARWQKELKGQQDSAAAKLQIDSRCCDSALVVSEALHFLYTADIKGQLGSNGRLLWQLLCLCVRYALPSTLRRYATAALIKSLEQPNNVVVIPVLLKAATSVGLSTAELRYVVHQLLCHPEAMAAAGDDVKRAQAVKFAVEELERALGEYQQQPQKK